MGRHWAAVETKHRCEGAVSRRLREQGYETYHPLCRAPRNDRGVRRILPLFDRITFVRIKNNVFASILGTRGVVRLMMSGENQPARVGDEEIARIRSCENELGYVTIAADEPPVFDLRQAVRATGGAWAGQTGQYMGEKTKQLVEVSFVMMGKEFSVTMQRHMLRAAA